MVKEAVYEDMPGTYLFRIDWWGKRSTIYSPHWGYRLHLSKPGALRGNMRRLTFKRITKRGMLSMWLHSPLHREFIRYTPIEGKK
jgi:hypothetical protein